MRKIVIFIFIIITISAVRAQERLPQAAADSLVSDSGIIDEQEDKNWWHLLKKGKLSLQDPDVEYPRFMKFCVDVYNWGDRAFNSYDPEYVMGTGKRWKVFLRNDNLSDFYHLLMHDQDKSVDMIMVSEPTVNVGTFLQYMAVSVGYSLDFSNIIGNKPINRKNFEFSFTCARFSAEIYYTENNGGSYVRKFGDYNNGRLFKEFFPGVTVKNYGIDAYYFFNNRKYSQGAAYNFAKYQLKSAGSFLVGLSHSNQNILVDFTKLPANLKPQLIGDFRKGRFHYNEYCLLLGYGYNWVFAKNWLFNITAVPSVGISHSTEDSLEGSDEHFGMNYLGKIGITYNIGDIYMGLAGNANGHLYRGDNFTFVNTNINISFSTGVRF